MKLLLDFGNTRLKYALYEEHRLHSEGILSDLSPASFNAIPHFNQVEKIMLSAVIDLPKETETLLAPKRVSSNPQLRSNNYMIESLGEDRKYLALGAGPNSLVICLGTCITYNAVNSANEFFAGAISPGLSMRAKAMAIGTAKLPEVSMEVKFPHWGTDTKSNLLAGVMAGVEYELVGFVENMKKSYPDIRVIMTGGDAPYFANLFPVDEHLLWKGMLQVIE
jgi:type III pantothenate kinase